MSYPTDYGLSTERSEKWGKNKSMMCPVCRKGTIDSFDHEICGRCGIHFGYEDCFGGLFTEKEAHAILRQGYIEAGEPDWSREPRSDWSGPFLRSLHPFPEKAREYLAKVAEQKSLVKPQDLV